MLKKISERILRIVGKLPNSGYDCNLGSTHLGHRTEILERSTEIWGQTASLLPHDGHGQGCVF